MFEGWRGQPQMIALGGFWRRSNCRNMHGSGTGLLEIEARGGFGLTLTIYSRGPRARDRDSPFLPPESIRRPRHPTGCTHADHCAVVARALRTGATFRSRHYPHVVVKIALFGSASAGFLQLRQALRRRRVGGTDRLSRQFQQRHLSQRAEQFGDRRPPCPRCGGPTLIIETFERRKQPRAPPLPTWTAGRTSS
jgi:hypothetical protein